jgi:4-azaleucine resistance transporter AzlC
MSKQNADFRRGMRDSVPVLIGVGPFGLLFGALAVENGMGVFEATFMSAAMFAGASQMVGLDLFGTRIAPWVIVLSIFAVNFRHILYSASLGSKIAHYTALQKAVTFFFLTDPQYAAAEQQYEQGRSISFAWYVGMAIPIYLLWIGETILGGLFGKFISDPHALGVDLLLPIYFLGLVMGFRRRRNWLPVVVASGVASIVVYYTIGSPWHVSLGAIVGVLFAALIAGNRQGPAPAGAELETL